MRARPLPLPIALGLLVLLAPATSMADIINVDAMFAANSRSIWKDGAGFSIDTGPRFVGVGPWDFGDKAGDVVKGPFGTQFGAEIGAKTTGKVGIGYGLKVDSGTFDIRYPLRAQFDVPTVAFGPPGGAPTVTINTSLVGLTGGVALPLPDHPGGTVTFQSATLQVRAPDLQAFVDLAAEVTAFAGARVCVGVCYGPALGPFGVNESREIAAINRGGDGTIRFLGDKVVSANQSVSGLGGLITGSFNLPHLDSSSAALPGGGFDDLKLTSSGRDSVAVVSANVAQIIANSVGLPVPLSGKIGPIGYNLLQANAGAFIDVELALDFTPSATGRLVFTSDVVPQIGGVDQAPTRTIDFTLGQPVTFTPTHVGGIGVEPIIMLGGTVHNRISLVVGPEVSVKALGVSVGDATLGPLINKTIGKGELATINVWEDEPFGTTLGTVMGRPFNLSFPSCVQIFGAGELSVPTGECAISGYGGGGSFADGTGFVEDELTLFGCAPRKFGDPFACFEFPGPFTSPYFPSAFGDVFVGSADARDFDRVVPGPFTTDESQSAALASLGGASTEPFIIPPGDPLSAFATSGPATAVLLGLAFAGLLAGRVSRRKGGLTENPRWTTTQGGDMKAAVFTVTLLGMLWAGPVVAQQAVPFAGERVVRVMTRNVSTGVDAQITAVGTATSFPDLLLKVAAVYQAYFTRNFPERAAALAAEVEATRPDLIGLQEAILVRTQSPPDGPATPATTVALDYVQILLDALAARGLHYEVVVQSITFDAELPSALGFDVRHTDREVILARTDLRTADLKPSNAQGGTFVTNCTLPSPIVGPITFRRGWVAVDVKIRGKSFRLISTHLDIACLPFTSAIQRAQAAEVLHGPAAAELPVVLVGDLNSPGDGSGVTYNDVIAAGWADAAVEAGVGSALTCCQAADLLNPASLLDRRVDFVLFRGAFSVRGADIVGDNPADRTPSGLWPSDHAGVAATLELPHP